MNAISNWAGQVTTGHGAMVLVGTLLACLHGDMTWAAGAPLLAAGFIGVIWPENTALAANAQKVATDAQPVAADIEAVIRAYLARLVAKPPAPPAATAGTVSLQGCFVLAGVALILAALFRFGGPLDNVAIALGFAVLAIGFAIAVASSCGHRSGRRMAGATSRRDILEGAGALSLLGLLEACGTDAPALTSAQILADTNGIIALLQTDLPLMAAADPQLMAPATLATAQSDLALAQALTGQLSPQVSALTGATTLQKVETYVNVGLDAVAAVATAPQGSPLAAYALPMQAIMILVRGVEAYVNATLGTNATTAALRARATAPGMTPDKARQILGIRAVA